MTHPIDQISHLDVYDPSFQTSGGHWNGVPVGVYISPSIEILLTFISPSKTPPFLFRKIFAAFRSLCTILSAWRASIPSKTYLNIYHILFSLINYLFFLACSSFESRSPESAISITMHKTCSYSSKNASLYAIIFLWLTEAKILISFSAFSLSFLLSLASFTYFIA